MNIKKYLLFFIFGLAAAISAQVRDAKKPNIIIILADDLGYGDCGSFNSKSKIKTPNIDQLAQEGMSFTDAHSASTTCTPSRYGLLTGINPCRTGVLNTLLKIGRPIISQEEFTIADFLKDQGYSTKMIGKWHLGFEMNMRGKKPSFDFSENLKGGPMDCGFDYYYGVHSSASSSPMFYIKGRSAVSLPTKISECSKVKSNGKVSKVKIKTAEDFVMEELSSNLCADAVRIIKEHARTNEKKPLFLYYASPIPHQPWTPGKKFKGKSTLGLYGDFVMQFDDVVGQINQALKDTAMDENTLLIFTSDNGPGPGASMVMAKSGHAVSASLRGQKSDAWEGGHRVPFIVKWPKIIEDGVVNESLINATDIFSTLAELLKIDLQEKYTSSAADSHSFFSALLNSTKKYERPPMVTGRHAIRKGDWKLISTKKHTDAAKLVLDEFQLYNLKDDIAEQNNLIKTHPERAENLFKQFKNYTKNRQIKGKNGER